MSNTGSTLPRRQLGRYLRDLRQQVGLTLDEAARLIERSASSLQRLETGHAERIRLLDVRELCTMYNADETTTAGVIGLAQQASVKSWWHRYGDLIPFAMDDRGERVEPSVVYLENLTGSLYLENDDDVRSYYESYRAIHNIALDEIASRNLIRQIAREYAS